MLHKTARPEWNTGIVLAIRNILNIKDKKHRAILKDVPHDTRYIGLFRNF